MYVLHAPSQRAQACQPATSRSKCKPVRRPGRFARLPSWPSHFRTSRVKAEGRWTTLSGQASATTKCLARESVLSNRRQTNAYLVQKENRFKMAWQVCNHKAVGAWLVASSRSVCSRPCQDPGRERRGASRDFQTLSPLPAAAGLRAQFEMEDGPGPGAL
jgi:hypothetical protein